MSFKNPTADEAALDLLHADFAQRAYDAATAPVRVKSGKLEPKGWTKLGALVLAYASALPADAPTLLVELARVIQSEHAASGLACGTRCGKNFGLVQRKIQQALLRDAPAAPATPTTEKPRRKARQAAPALDAPPAAGEPPAAAGTDTRAVSAA